MAKIQELRSDQLYRKCDPAKFSFDTTDEIGEKVNIVGQDRASEAIEFGMNISYPGYNIFVLGPSGMGKLEIVQEFFENKAKSDPTPSDWIYVHDFDEPDQPDAIELPPGMGTEYEKDINNLIEEMQTALSAAFESEEYQNRHQSIFESFKEKQAELFNELQEKANKEGLAMIKTPSGIAFAPRDKEGVLSPEEVNQLSEAEREEMQETIEILQEELHPAAGAKLAARGKTRDQRVE